MSEAATSRPTEVSEYLSRQQCSRQWRHFLHAMAEEFASALPADQLRTLAQRIGVRFANALPLTVQPTLDGVQTEMSRVWLDLDWGWVSLQQHDDHVDIHHQGSPLVSAFGSAGGDWALGFLEGVYQQWFEQQGAPGLRVTQSQAADGWGSVCFRLSR
ncbi:cellulose biosynthesis protein BcsD [Curvibacter sp. RS43]|jgi:hypothetical protein|uniref:cellulose biosynthesis protein BcsD n=1 Tax=Curvibacter microcysteis TaxID=3026419 RepID=UPI00235F4BCA|nr:cellulose biosynthesis protein BcsD [Curvibacter sp. RS43]MDD0810845.1 cellulose biosynthesis protein BcsD [Curvibacter sp. RS43]